MKSARLHLYEINDTFAGPGTLTLAEKYKIIQQELLYEDPNEICKTAFVRDERHTRWSRDVDAR